MGRRAAAERRTTGSGPRTQVAAPRTLARAPRVEVVAADARTAERLRAQLTRERVVGWSDGPGGESADLAVVWVDPETCTVSLALVADRSRRGPVLAIGPVALSSRVLRLGAIGYLGPGDLATDLTAAIGAVHARRRYLGPSVVDGYLADGLAPAAALNRLSSRELEIVCRAARGEAPARTAAAIGVAAEAVTQYRLRARSKLGLETTRELRAFAVSVGLR